MIVVVGYTDADLHPRVVRSIYRQGVAPTMKRCVDDTDWPVHLLWSFAQMRAGHDVLFVEHDVELRYGVVRGFAECEEPWCFHAYPFSVPYDETGLGDWFSPLGCTRLRSELGAVLLDRLDTDEFRETWVARDVYVSEALAGAGYRSHRHPGDMIHHHDYKARPSPLPPRGMDARVRQQMRSDGQGDTQQ